MFYTEHTFPVKIVGNYPLTGGSMLGHGKRALRREIKQLRKELLKQWLDAHADHCTNEYPHDGDCHWPPPIVLGELPKQGRGDGF
jgi:hypothetical protein